MRNKKLFTNYSYARYATDVFFHHCNRPSGYTQEWKIYYSSKLKLYGFKQEVSVVSNGLALNCSFHFPGSKSDVDKFYESIEFHTTALARKEDEKEIAETGELSSEYSNRWGVIADKGYQGGEHVRLIHPKKKPPGRILTAEEHKRNKKISSDRIVVENWFGRFCNLWTLFSVKYRWSEKNYEDFFHFAMALTNLYVRWNPLRQNDLNYYNRVKNRLYHIGNSIRDKRHRSQKNYRDNKLRRLKKIFEDDEMSGEETLPP